MKVVLLVYGNKHHGKTTLAKYIAQHSPSVAQIDFADRLKKCVSEMFGVPLEWCYSDKKDTEIIYGKTLRHWLQWFGTDIAQEQIHMGIWAHRFVDDALASGKDLVIAGARFKDREVAGIRDKYSGIIKTVKIVRKNYPVDLRHSSERAVYELKPEDVDIYLETEKMCPKEFRQLAKRVMHQLGLPVIEKDRGRL